MQSLPIYLYPNVTTVILDLDPTVSGVNNVMYQRDLKFQKGVKNKVRIQIKNSDQKSLPISSTSTYIFSMFDVTNNRMFIQKPLVILDDSVTLAVTTDQTVIGNTLSMTNSTGAKIGQTVTGFGIAANSIVIGISTTTVTLNNITTHPVTSATTLTFGTSGLRGVAELTLSESDTINLLTSTYSFTVKYLDTTAGGYLPTYANTYYGMAGTVTLADDVYPTLSPSTEVTSFLKTWNQQNNLYYYPCGNLYANPEYHSNGSALHTMAFYMTNYKGTVTIQGTLANQPDSTNWYYTIATLTYTGFTGIDYLNFNGIYSYVRIYHTPATAPGDSTNDNPAFFGSVDRLLYRS
jgi:hypothetical protein